MEEVSASGEPHVSPSLPREVNTNGEIDKACDKALKLTKDIIAKFHLGEMDEAFVIANIMTPIKTRLELRQFSEKEKEELFLKFVIQMFEIQTEMFKDPRNDDTKSPPGIVIVASKDDTLYVDGLVLFFDKCKDKRGTNWFFDPKNYERTEELADVAARLCPDSNDHPEVYLKDDQHTHKGTGAQAKRYVAGVRGVHVGKDCYTKSYAHKIRHHATDELLHSLKEETSKQVQAENERSQKKSKHKRNELTMRPRVLRGAKHILLHW